MIFIEDNLANNKRSKQTEQAELTELSEQTEWTEPTEQMGQSERIGSIDQSKRLFARWRHCSSESYGRSGLTMYIRECRFSAGILQTCPETPEFRWTPEIAPSLNYRIQCSGGTYTLWMLSKFNVREEGVFGIGIDGKRLAAEKLYGNGALWGYEAEQVYRWVPVAQIPLAEGMRTLHIYAFSFGMCYDRFYLTKRTEQPSMDMEW